VKAADRGTLPAELETSVEALRERLDRGDVFLLDVREPREWDIARIEGSTLIPLGELPKRFTELPQGPGASDIVIVCKSGVRSAKAVNLLREQGFDRVLNLKGGILAWISRIDPTLHSY
jgi:rhodanese-related sulfurtransferase